MMPIIGRAPTGGAGRVVAGRSPAASTPRLPADRAGRVAEASVKETGLRNGAHGADKFGLNNAATIHWNLPDTVLVEHAIANREGFLVRGGAFYAETGAHTAAVPRTSSSLPTTPSNNSWVNPLASAYSLLITNAMNSARNPVSTRMVPFAHSVVVTDSGKARLAFGPTPSTGISPAVDSTQAGMRRHSQPPPMLTAAR